MLDYIIDNNNNNNNEFNDTKNIIQYNPIYDCILSKYKNIVLITSKIYVSSYPFSYIGKRSIYNSDERFADTIKTIKSVHLNIPNSYIVLIDNSNFNNKEKEKINSEVSLFLNPTHDKNLNKNTNKSLIKALGELSQTKYALEKLKKLNIQCDNFFKISGRYKINNNFNLNKYLNNKNIFCKNKDVTDRNYYYTCFYKLEKTTYLNFSKNINDCINYYNINNKADDLEVILPKKINYNFELIDILGITQKQAVWKNENQI
jgi:hypothetical protein